MAASIKAGSEIESQCGKCHDATMHVVLAMAKDKPRACRCLTCEAEHLFRAPKGPEEPRARTKSGPALTDVEVAYKKAKVVANDDSPVPYSMSGKFARGQTVTHKKFGEGVVITVLQAQVVEVVFPDATRRLVMNR